MSSKKFVIQIIALSVIYSCTEETKKNINTNCTINIDQLLKNDSNRLQINDRAKDGTITQLVDKTSDSVTTGAYYFYADGSLQSYKFFASSTRYQYNEEYDPRGNITLVEGSPLVLHAFRQIDSSVIRFTFLFSTLHKEYKEVNIKTNGGVQFKAELSLNRIFTNMKSITFDLPVAKTLNSTIIYTDCQLINECLKKQWILKDTATFKDASL